jgi:DNA topoisomerase-3
MLKRRGKNGDFWGCSNYPRCRMSCDDKSGVPDFSSAKGSANRTNGSSNRFAGENMADVNREFAPLLSARELIARMERQEKAPRVQNAARPDPATAVLCPRCREGRLRRINGKNGAFWGCTNYPHCTATYDDIKGKPNI